MNTTLPKLLLASLLAVLMTAVSANKVSADVSMVVSPPRIDLEGKPGDTLQKVVKITNTNPEEDLIVKAFVIDFIVQDDTGTPVKINSQEAGKYVASPWFTLEKSELTISPKATEQIVVVVSVPDNALPGGHYAGVFFEPIQAKGQKATISYTAAQVGSLFGITVAGDIKYDALIKDFSVKNRLSEFGPIELSATIENQSDTHISPQANIVIHDLLGRELANLPLDKVNVFPYTSRHLQTTWDTVWGFGRYMATLNATYGPAGQVVSRTLYFWIIPYRLLAALVVVILVMVSLYVSIRRHLVHRADNRDNEIDELKRKIAEMENRHR